MKRATNWDDDETFGSDILGVGSMHTLDDKGTRKKKTQIGFIRQKVKDNARNKRTNKRLR